MVLSQITAVIYSLTLIAGSFSLSRFFLVISNYSNRTAINSSKRDMEINKTIFANCVTVLVIAEWTFKNERPWRFPFFYLFAFNVLQQWGMLQRYFSFWNRKSLSIVFGQLASQLRHTTHNGQGQTAKRPSIVCSLFGTQMTFGSMRGSHRTLPDTCHTDRPLCLGDQCGAYTCLHTLPNSIGIALLWHRHTHTKAPHHLRRTRARKWKT